MSAEPRCPIHPHAILRCMACAGAKGGAVASPKQIRAAKRNAKRGGAPRGKRKPKEGAE